MTGPILEREGISKLGEAALEDLIAHPPRGSDVMRSSIRMTSGTSGRAPIVLATDHARGNVLGFETGHTLVIAQGGNNARVGNTLFTLTNTRDETRILIADESDLKPELGALLRDLQPDRFRGFPSFMRKVGAYLGDARGCVRAMKITGEKWTPAMRSDFERTFPHARFEVIYAIVEVGVVGTSDCPHLAPDHYHPVDGAEVEIESTDDTGVGDVLITRSVFRSFTPTRYRVGDSGRMSGTVCACGKKSFELLGRKGTDYLKVAGAVLFREEFDRVAFLCSDLFDDYRAEVARRIENGAERGEIILSTYREDGTWRAGLEREIAQRFSDELFLTQTRTLSDLVNEGYFEPLRVVRRNEPFPFKSKEVKLSERKMT